jgi:hypothetical protein
LIPPWEAHCAALTTTHMSKAPVADDVTQHWIVPVTMVVVVVAPGLVVVVAPGVVVVVLLGGQGLGEQQPAPTLIPCSSEHCAALVNMHVLKTIADDPDDSQTQHWIIPPPGVVVVVVPPAPDVVDVVERTVVVVAETGHSAQQLLPPWLPWPSPPSDTRACRTAPPALSHALADVLMPQRPGRSHATAARLPQMDRAAQCMISPRHAFDAFARTKRATQLMNCPWFFWPSHGQAAARSASPQRSAWQEADVSSPPWPAWFPPFLEEAGGTRGATVRNVTRSTETIRTERARVILLPSSRWCLPPHQLDSF